ncbi:MAG: hypothetical protein JNL18_20315 [Planctomycetaceae bacterium]|nr:hypothetical protein [Planctomycetaceae bacterium]
MSFYTSIILSPLNSEWVASADVIRKIADWMRLQSFDLFTVSREVIPPGDPSLFDEERYEEVFKTDGPVAETLAHYRAGQGYCTHMMFPYGDFMKELCKEIEAKIPASIAGDYSPWGVSISSGRWSTVSIETGLIEHAGAFAVDMSGSGCPANTYDYLEHLLAVDGIKSFLIQLESLTGQPLRALFDLS